MSNILCPNCDYEIYYDYIVKKINLNDINNEKFDKYFISCVIQIRFSNNIIAVISI